MNKDSTMTFEVWENALREIMELPFTLPKLSFHVSIDLALEGFGEWRERNKGYDFLTNRDTVHVTGKYTTEQIIRLRQLVFPAHVIANTP